LTLEQTTLHFVLYAWHLYYYEWNNLAENPKHAAKLKELRAKAPKEFAPLAPVTKK